MKPSLASRSARKRTHRPEPKPFSAGEARAKLRGEQFLAEAHHHARSADPEMAVRCCIAAVRQTFGIARYLMVRDQTDDLLARIDPLQLIRRRLYGARQMAGIPDDGVHDFVSLRSFSCTRTDEKAKGPNPNTTLEVTPQLLPVNGLAK
jgi:hypothetical protein